MATATNRLQTRGISGFSADIIVQQLADRNNRSAQQVFEALTAATTEDRGGGQGQGHRAGYGSGGKAGGGPGRKTLAEFCAEEGIEMKNAIARLQAKGIKAEAGLTLREIAVNNGYSRPYEILDILRAK